MKYAYKNLLADYWKLKGSHEGFGWEPRDSGRSAAITHNTWQGKLFYKNSETLREVIETIEEKYGVKILSW